MSLFRTRVAAALLGGALLASMMPAVPVLAIEGITGMSVMGGDYARTWRSPETFFHAPYDNDGTPLLSGLTLDTNLSLAWGMIRIGAPEGQPLAVGSYPNATSEGGASPLLWVNEYGCLPSTGSFEILELEATGDTVTSLAVRFVLACDVTVGAYAGEYRYNSTIDFAGPELSPHDSAYNTVNFGNVTGGTTSSPVTVSLTNSGTKSLTVSDVSLTGPDPTSFEIVGDSCSGLTIAPGASCPVVVRARPPLLGGFASAHLTFSADTARATFGERLWVNGLTATSVEIVTPASVTGLDSIRLRAKIHPQTDITLAGSVTFYIDDEWIGSSPFGENAEASVIGMFQLGEHELRAVYEPSCCQSPQPAAAVGIKTITALRRVDLDLTSAFPTTIEEGTAVTFSANMSTSTVPASGILRIRDVTTGLTLAKKAVSGTMTSLSTPLIFLPVGEHKIVAQFIGDPAFVQTTVTRIQTVTKDTTVKVQSPTVSPTTFYPVVDGYRDKIKVSGTALEQATVTVRIYNPSGTLIRTLSLGSLKGAYSTTWNGRMTSGTLLPAGTYKVRQTLVDVRNNRFTKDTAVTLSWRKVKWITTSISKYGDSYAASSKAGTGSITKSGSAFSRGVKLSGGSKEGYALARWSFTVRSALAYKGLKISVLGKGTQSTSRAILAFAQDSVGRVVGPQYAWWTQTGGVTGHINDRIVLLDVETDGPMSGSFDVAKTKVTYTYAVWP